MKIDSIISGISDIQKTNSEQNIKLENFSIRVTKAEESVKSAHKRIDNLDKIVNHTTIKEV